MGTSKSRQRRQAQRLKDSLRWGPSYPRTGEEQRRLAEVSKHRAMRFNRAMVEAREAAKTD
jgi:hypothetical protein